MSSRSERWGAPHLEAIAPYVPGRSAADVEREYGVRDAVELASNESPLGASPRALEAARRALATAHRYPDDDVHALRARLATEHGVGEGEVLCGHGSNELIDLLCRTVLPPDGHAVIGNPSFASYALAIQGAAATYTSVPLRGGLFWDLDAVRDALEERTRLIFVDSPNNPTSTHVPGDELEAFLKAVPERVTVVIDEAYHHFVDAHDYRSAMTMRDAHPRVVVLRTFSKAHGLSALRVGYAVMPEALQACVQRLRLPFNVNAVAQMAALASLDDHAHLDDYLTLNRSERTRLGDALSARGWKVAPSQANFLYAVPPTPAAAAYEGLLRQGVIVRRLGPGMGLRITIGSAADNTRLMSAIDAL